MSIETKFKIGWSKGYKVILDRYIGSSLAYGTALGLDQEWLYQTQRFLPQPDTTILLDITPDLAAQRKQFWSRFV